MNENTLKVQLVDAEGSSLGEVTFPTTLTWLDLLQRLPLLETPVTPTAGQSAPGRSKGKGITGKYAPLARFLDGQGEGPLTLTFRDVERTLGFPLPPTARGAHARSWWANTTTHVQGRAWLDRGWKTANIDPERETLEFHRA